MSPPRSNDKYFAFDQSFGKESTQDDLFKNTTQNLCPPLLDGFNSTVFAYGSTGAGKTFTMIGSETDPGIMTSTTSEIFKLINSRKDQNTFKVTVSFLEIYNETIRDLIMKSTETLELREDPKEGS